MTTSSSVCTLCGLDLSTHFVMEENQPFCCHGCQVVFRILSTQNQVANFTEHPIFKQAVQSGLISNPALLEQIHRNKSLLDTHETERLYLEIQEMWCPSCAQVISLLLLQEKGIKSCIVDYTTDLASIEFAPRFISKDRISAMIAKFGYHPISLENSHDQAISGSLYLRFIVAAFFSLNIMMFAYPLYATYFAFDDQGIGPLFAWLSLFASLPVLIFSAQPILRRFYYSLKTGLFGMEVLVVLGISSAFGLSLYELYTGGIKVYFDSMTVIITFVLLGKIIESKAKFSAKSSLARLSRSLPKRGRKRFDNGLQKFIPIKDIVKNDILVVLTGEKIILDGIVIEGEGACDESLINGESMPVIKQIGQVVLGGTILKQGILAYKVSSTKEDSSLQRIIAMVQQGMEHKAQYVRFADQIVRWFVPAVILIALCTAICCHFFFILQEGDSPIMRAISILLISCPCAIGIAAPLAESHLLNALAKLGVIVRNRGCLAYLGNETLFIFDKTGTLTEGKFTVLEGLEKMDEKGLEVLKAMGVCSIHPIALAIDQAINRLPCKLDKVEEFAGKGIKASKDGFTYYLGSESFFGEAGIPILKEPFQKEGIVTTVYYGHLKEKGRAIHLGDRIKKEAKKALSELYPAKILLLSGDSQETVEAVARFCGFSESVWSASPFQKKACVEKLREKNEIICMLGDGINDAPALSAAHIGISVVSATDISIQVSDILLTNDQLDVIAKMRHLGRKGRRILKQNIFWAFFYNILGIGLAIFGYLSPIFSAFAMVASSLIVILNAQRLGNLQ
jgi:heavy metal translocating P-type ATPase